MTTSLILACLWGIAANIAAIVPSNDNHVFRAWLLIAAGVPLLGYLTVENGPWVGLVALAAGMSVLRWPVIFLTRRLQRRLAGRP